MKKRELIFRAWDGKKMHQWNSVDHSATDFITGTPYPKLHYLPMSWLVGDSNDWIWMQFTGLACKDLDGKKHRIYEGDIIRHANNEISVIEWSEEDWGWIMRGLDKNRRSIFDSSVDVLIGNIYQDKELLDL